MYICWKPKGEGGGGTNVVNHLVGKLSRISMNWLAFCAIHIFQSHDSHTTNYHCTFPFTWKNVDKFCNLTEFVHFVATSPQTRGVGWLNHQVFAGLPHSVPLCRCLPPWRRSERTRWVEPRPAIWLLSAPSTRSLCCWSLQNVWAIEGRAHFGTSTLTQRKGRADVNSAYSLNRHTCGVVVWEVIPSSQRVFHDDGNDDERYITAQAHPGLHVNAGFKQCPPPQKKSSMSVWRVATLAPRRFQTSCEKILHIISLPVYLASQQLVLREQWHRHLHLRTRSRTRQYLSSTQRESFWERRELQQSGDSVTKWTKQAKTTFSEITGWLRFIRVSGFIQDEIFRWQFVVTKTSLLKIFCLSYLLPGRVLERLANLSRHQNTYKKMALLFRAHHSQTDMRLCFEDCK